MTVKTDKSHKATPHQVYVIDEKFTMGSIEVWKPVYVGCTVHTATRWAEHQKPGFAKRPMTKAIIDKGVDNFRFRIVSEDQPKSVSRLIEDALIVALNTLAPNGYNRPAVCGKSETTTLKIPHKNKRNVEWTDERRQAQSERMAEYNEKLKAKKAADAQAKAP